MKLKQVKAVKILAMQNADYVRYSRKTNEFEVRGGFFYRHGGTAKKFCLAVMKSIPGIKVRKSNYGERWRAWPKDSYWWVKFEVADIDAIVAEVEKHCETLKMTLDELYKESIAAMS